MPNETEVNARRAALEAAMDAEFYGEYMRTRASRQRVGSPILRVEGIMGKRTEGSKSRYNKTAPATRRMTEVWANRRVA